MKINLKRLLTRKRNNKNQEDMLDRAGSAFTSGQRKVADYLNAKAAGWSPQKTKTVFILFFLLAGNVILFITGRAILSANGPPKQFKVQRLFIPPPLPLPGMKMPPKADSNTNK